MAPVDSSRSATHSAAAANGDTSVRERERRDARFSAVLPGDHRENMAVSPRSPRPQRLDLW